MWQGNARLPSVPLGPRAPGSARRCADARRWALTASAGIAATASASFVGECGPVVTHPNRRRLLRSDGEAEETRRCHEVPVVGHDWLGDTDNIKGRAFEDRPEARRGIEAATVDDPGVTVIVGPAGNGLGEAPPRTEPPAQVQVGQAQVEQRGRQLRAQRLAGLRRPKVQPALPWPQAQSRDGALLVPVGRNHAPRHWLLATRHLLQGGKGLDRGAESCQCLEETGSPLPGVQDAELALRIVEAAATNELMGRPRKWEFRVDRKSTRLNSS